MGNSSVTHVTFNNFPDFQEQNIIDKSKLLKARYEYRA